MFVQIRGNYLKSVPNGEKPKLINVLTLNIAAILNKADEDACKMHI